MAYRRVRAAATSFWKKDQERFESADAQTWHKGKNRRSVCQPVVILNEQAWCVDEVSGEQNPDTSTVEPKVRGSIPLPLVKRWVAQQAEHRSRKYRDRSVSRTPRPHINQNPLPAPRARGFCIPTERGNALSGHQVEGVDYTPEGIEQVRTELAEHRNHALGLGEMRYAVLMSHVIALLSELKRLTEQEAKAPDA